MTGRRFRIFALIVVAVAVGVGVTVVLTKPAKGEIFLESANSVGPHPFTTAAAVPITTTTSTSTTVGGATTTTALYGGSGSQKRCDPDALAAFLMAHLDKARAWVDAQNDDPTLKWFKETTPSTLYIKLTVEDIPAYIASLKPGFLAQDTRVENHGFFNGKATPHESVLQAGTAMLFDVFGVPRSRCACGNPTGRPEPVSNIRYIGFCWPGCHDHPYCSGSDCGVTTTTEPTSTTVGEVTTTTEHTTITTRPTGTTAPPDTTGTTAPPKTTTTRTSDTTRTTSPPTTRPQGTTTTTSPNGKP